MIETDELVDRMINHEIIEPDLKEKAVEFIEDKRYLEWSNGLLSSEIEMFRLHHSKSPGTSSLISYGAFIFVGLGLFFEIISDPLTKAVSIFILAIFGFLGMYMMIAEKIPFKKLLTVKSKINILYWVYWAKKEGKLPPEITKHVDEDEKEEEKCEN
ncbi:MAG: hypothetical protein ACFFD4_36965 [Candidatus Odinarchaeota archaeon]